MPDYGVDTPDWNPLPWSWAAEKLAANRNFWVVTASTDARPHALPVWGVWADDEHRFAFRAAHVRARPSTWPPTRTPPSRSTTRSSASRSRARRRCSTTARRRETWIARYLAKYVPISPELTADFLRANLVFEFVPERAFAIIEREDDFSARATKWTFDPANSPDG